MLKSNQKIDDDTLSEERKTIVFAAKFQKIHWIAVLGSFFITLSAWYLTKQNADQKAYSQFVISKTRIKENLTERLQKYEDALLGGVATIKSHNNSISHNEWKNFAKNLKIDSKYPGINGIGVVLSFSSSKRDSIRDFFQKERPYFYIKPQTEENEIFPIVYIEPESKNKAAIGLDLAHEKNRYEAAKAARESGTPHITGPIVLVQDTDRTPGFLFYAPFYKNDTNAPILKDHIGWVYAPFIVKKLLIGTLDPKNRLVSIRISDDDEVIYDEFTKDNKFYTANPQFTAEEIINLYGRKWKIEYHNSNEFQTNFRSNQPTIILIAGLCIDSLLITLFLVLGYSNRRALRYADRLNSELRKNTLELKSSNSDLEKFAYITSHDLKTPLRGMNDLTEYLEEDLDEYLKSPNINPDIPKNIERIKTQIKRMNNLITGILNYSKIDKNENLADEIIFEKFAQQICDDLKLGKNQYTISGNQRPFYGDSIQFHQVLSNLISNAVKYHPNRTELKIDLIETLQKDRNIYYIKDNGNGIDPKFHTKIFEPFKTLQSKDKIESTGIGLSIVQKIINNKNGQIKIESKLNNGAIFIFDWPNKGFQKNG